MGEVCMQKHLWQQHATVTTVLAMTNRNDPICVTLPKVAKASKEGVTIFRVLLS